MESQTNALTISEHPSEKKPRRKYIVVDIDDFIKYIRVAVKYYLLQNDLDDIRAGREADGRPPLPEYIVVESTDPWASEVIEVLKRHGAWDENEIRSNP